MLCGVPWPCCDTAKETSSQISAASCLLPPQFMELMPCSSCLKCALFGERAPGCWLCRSSWLSQARKQQLRLEKETFTHVIYLG